MRDFTTEDFSGSGQYIIRNDKKPGEFIDPSYMSTIMYKIGYLHGNGGREHQRYCIISMSDGWTKDGYFITKHPDGSKILNTSDWKYIAFEGEDAESGKKKLADYLNNPELSQEFRFASQEEVVRVVLYQKSRWK